MGMTRVAVLAAAALVLSGCGADVAADPTDGSAQPDLLMTRYAVTVLDDGEGAELCLGGVAESLPPQCGGPPIPTWDWTEHEGDFDQASGVRWGEFHVVGTYDGTRFTATEVTPGEEWQGTPTAPAEPAAPVTAYSDGELRDIQRSLTALPEHLSSWTEAGHVFLSVIFDDGALQDRLDEEYGEHLVVVSSALIPHE